MAGLSRAAWLSELTSAWWPHHNSKRPHDSPEQAVFYNMGSVPGRWRSLPCPSQFRQSLQGPVCGGGQCHICTLC